MREIKMVKWDPIEYARSSSAQLAWAREIISRLNLSGDENILDIGCGDGKVTAEFLRHVPRGSVTGIDSSRDMISYAVKTYPKDMHPGLSFLEMNANRIDLTARFHLVFSNATLHWIEDHRSVLSAIQHVLLPGGRLVISCGGRGNAGDFAAVVRTLTDEARWRRYFQDFGFPYFFYGPDEYADWVKEAGLRPLRVELIPKDMVHKGKDELAGWVRTTWMPYTQRIPEGDREDFIREAVETYIAEYPPDETGATHLGMVRLEVEAVKE
jgi:trans-aconitate 2-methyltransferase